MSGDARKAFFWKGRVLISKREYDAAASTGHWRTGACRIASARNEKFRPLSQEECETHHKWRRAVVVFYGSIAIAAVLLSIVFVPPGPSAVKNNPAYSAIASRGQNNSH